MAPRKSTLVQCRRTVGQNMGERFSIATKRASVTGTLSPPFQDMKYRQIYFVNFDIIISWKLLLIQKNFQLQNCSEFDVQQLCN